LLFKSNTCGIYCTYTVYNVYTVCTLRMLHGYCQCLILGLHGINNAVFLRTRIMFYATSYLNMNAVDKK